jgi:hypothetical protein
MFLKLLLDKPRCDMVCVPARQGDAAGEVMKILAAFAALAACLAVCSPAHAGTSAPGPISNILSNSSGRLFFEIGGARAGQPACAIHGRWVMDTTSPAGQSMAATLLSAFGLGKSVFVAGTGECGLWGDTESVDYLQIMG